MSNYSIFTRRIHYINIHVTINIWSTELVSKYMGRRAFISMGAFIRGYSGMFLLNIIRICFFKTLRKEKKFLRGFYKKQTCGFFWPRVKGEKNEGVW